MATEYDFSFDSGSSAVHNSITVTISVAVETIRNFNFVSDSSSVHNSITVTISVAVEAICISILIAVAAEFTVQSQPQCQ